MGCISMFRQVPPLPFVALSLCWVLRGLGGQSTERGCGEDGKSEAEISCPPIRDPVTDITPAVLGAV